MPDVKNIFAVGPRLTQERTLISKCRKCGAPGCYHDHDSIKEGWPGCYDPERVNQPVGNVCPNCNSRRPRDVKVGEDVYFEWPLPIRMLVRLWRVFSPAPNISQSKGFKS